MSEIEDFVKRHPHGLTYTRPNLLPKRTGPRNFIPGWAPHIWARMQLMHMAQERGYSPEELEQLRKALYEPQVIEVSLEGEKQWENK